MIRKRIMVIGPRGSGKTSLVNKLEGKDEEPRRKQDIIFGKYTMDVPSAYLENPSMYRHIISTAQNNASHILILIDQNNTREIYPPGFAKIFRCKVTGVIMKSDLSIGNEEKAIRQLEKIGVEKPYFKIAIPQNKGLAELKEYVFIGRE